MREVTILGSTGTIGVNTLNVISQHKEDFKVKALTSNSNVSLLIKQAKEFAAEHVVIADESKYQELKDGLPDVEVSAGNDAVTEAAKVESDIVISAIVGFAALRPTMAAIEFNKSEKRIIGLANKESLVCAGELIMNASDKYDVPIIPIDSEHSAIYQLLDIQEIGWVRKIIITASGGPFRELPLEEMVNVTPEMAVKHPNWKMGRKISVDSATMMNKGLELIEAKYLFDLEDDKLEAIIHPESYIHALVYYEDNSVFAQASVPDMRVPISYALGYPDRIENSSEEFDLTAIGKLRFEKPDYKRYPCLKLAEQAMADGGTMPIILNAANEVAVDMFLNNQLKFTEIAEMVEDVLNKSLNQKVTNLESIFEVDAQTRELAKARLAA